MVCEELSARRAVRAGLATLGRAFSVDVAWEVWDRRFFGLSGEVGGGGLFLRLECAVRLGQDERRE